MITFVGDAFATPKAWEPVRECLIQLGDEWILKNRQLYLFYGIEVEFPWHDTTWYAYRLAYLRRCCVRYLMNTCWNYDWITNRLVDHPDLTAQQTCLLLVWP